jgi:hypothetical protein
VLHGVRVAAFYACVVTVLRERLSVGR